MDVSRAFSSSAPSAARGGRAPARAAARHDPEDRLRDVARLEDLPARVDLGLRAGAAAEHVGELREDVAGEIAETRIALFRVRSSWRSASVSARHRELRRGVHAAVGTRHAMARHRRHVHDVAGDAAALHVLDRLARRDREPEDVHLEHLAPDLRRARRQRRCAAETALFTSTSTPPNDSRAVAMSASHVVLAAHVGGTHDDATAGPRGSPPRALRGDRHAAPDRHGGPLRRASARAVAAPMPLDAPVTTALPSREGFRHACEFYGPLTEAVNRCDLPRMPVNPSAIGKKLDAVTHEYDERDVHALRARRRVRDRRAASSRTSAT
jgi:hypothetical protein